MKLSASHGKTISDPIDLQIKRAIEDIEDDNGSFVILDTDNGFIQATGKIPDKLQLEFQIDGMHFQSLSQNLNVDQVKDMFIQFYNGLDDFKKDYEWKKVELSKAGSAGCAPLFFLSIAVLVWQIAL
ncbi:MAG: hypothetical protein LAT67_14025 [Balneolales bacterium]|nr:hypothetical protein [Balneolales bacterium]